MIEVKIYASKRNAFGFLMLTFALVSACLFNLYNGHTDFITWAGLVFFSMGIPVFMYRIFNDEPQLVISENGVCGTGTKKKTMSWDHFTDAYLHKVDRQVFICLVMATDKNTWKEKAGITKDMMEFNKLFLGVQEVNLNLSGLKCNKQSVLILLLNLIHKDTAEEKRKVLRAYLLSDSK